MYEPGNENAQDQYHQRRFSERFCKRHQRKDLHRQPLTGDHRQVERPRTGSGHCTRAVAYPQQRRAPDDRIDCLCRHLCHARTDGHAFRLLLVDEPQERVETVKGYASHEKETLERVINARNGAISAKTIDDKIMAENVLTSALAGLKITLEAYPDLKANQNFLQLQEEISDLENKLAAVRRYFNSATKELNNAVETFPSNLIAGMFGFKKEVMFDLGEQRATLEEAPKIKF